jgi:hypothetical protein
MNDTAPRPMGPATIAAACELHKSHEPRPTYCEVHHIIPQAWQAHWQPPQPWPNQGHSPDRAGVTLWDARTATLCRTGHGNVHYWLVQIMHILAYTLVEFGTDNEQALWHDALTEVRRRSGHEPGHADAELALQAIERYAAAGGSILDLTTHKLWGEIWEA